MKKTVGYMALAAFIGMQVSAATINWGTAQWLQGGDGSQDVCTTGTLVDSVNGGGNDVTLAGVTFYALANSGISLGGSDYGDFVNQDLVSPSLDSNYLALLDPGRYALTSLTINNLTAGQEYCVQVWSTDGRGGGSAGRYTVLDGTATVQQNDGSSDPTLGQQITGTFTADAASQTITVQGFFSDGTEHQYDAEQISAVQVRAIPEAASVGMIGLGAGLLLAARRFMRM